MAWGRAREEGGPSYWPSWIALKAGFIGRKISSRAMAIRPPSSTSARASVSRTA